MTEPAAHTPLHDRLVERLGAGIVQGRYPAGARLVMGELADEAGVSRSAVREAVRVLESLGLVQVRRKAGIEVLGEAHWNVYAGEVVGWRLAGAERSAHLLELGQLRAAIEPVAARLAADHATDAERQQLIASAMTMSEHAHGADRQMYLQADVTFHRTLLAASGNSMFAALGDVVKSVLTGRTEHALMPKQANAQALAWHREAAFAVAAGQADAAEAAMIGIVRESVAAALTRAGEAADSQGGVGAGSTGVETA